MKQKNLQRPQQPTPVELRDACLDLLRRKFYGTTPEEARAFAQDRSKLLAWVVLWPASWLNTRGVTIHGDDYRKIFTEVFMDAAAFVQSKVKYRPAYLRQVIQSHFRLHGEEYYEQAKSVRNMVESTMLLIGKTAQAAPDPVKELAAARDILTARKPKKEAPQAPFKQQLNLFG